MRGNTGGKNSFMHVLGAIRLCVVVGGEMRADVTFIQFNCGDGWNLSDVIKFALSRQPLRVISQALYITR